MSNHKGSHGKPHYNAPRSPVVNPNTAEQPKPQLPAQPGLPTRKSVEEAIRVFENFRDLCRLEMETGYWATTDFPSKHHINRLLQLAYRNRGDLLAAYGDGLTRHIDEIIPSCRAYVQFTRDPREQPEANNGQKVESKNQ